MAKSYQCENCGRTFETICHKDVDCVYCGSIGVVPLPEKELKKKTEVIAIKEFLPKRDVDEYEAMQFLSPKQIRQARGC